MTGLSLHQIRDSSIEEEVKRFELIVARTLSLIYLLKSHRIWRSLDLLYEAGWQIEIIRCAVGIQVITLATGLTNYLDVIPTYNAS